MLRQAPASALPIQYQGRHDLLGQARGRFLQAADVIQMDEGMRARLWAPMRVVQTHSPVRMEDGEIQVFSGYRVQHNNAMGPFFGGVRLHEDVDLDAITSLAQLVSWQCALLGIPFGGAKGGITVDPYQLKSSELERLVRRYASDMVNVFDPRLDVPGPDVGMGPRELAWMMDVISINRGHALPASVVGKPLSVGGTQGALEAVGGGLYVCTKVFLENQGKSLYGMRVAFDGFGKLARVAAQLFARDGAKVVAVGDRTGAIWREEGLHMHAVNLHAQGETGGVAGFPEAEAIDPSSIHSLDVDLLILAGHALALTRSTAAQVKARLVVEGTNAGITPEADRILAEHGIEVLPPILANAGGAIAAYFEWVQDNQQLFWSEDEFISRLKELLGRAQHAVHRRAQRHSLPWRQAAMVEALSRLGEASSLRGLYP